MAKSPPLGQLPFVPGMLIMDPISLLPMLLKAIAVIAKAPAQRHEICIKTLKGLGLEPTHPPADFDGVYAYTLVEYALAEDGKSEALLKLFTEKEIKAAFYEAFQQWKAKPCWCLEVFATFISNAIVRYT